MTPKELEPMSVDGFFEGIRGKLESLERAFRQGPVGPQQTVRIWEETLEVKLECEKFYRFLIDYWTVVNGVLWAHYPKEYREKIYPRVREALSPTIGLAGPTPSLRDRPKAKTLLDVAAEIFLARHNEPLSISELVSEMKRTGTQFRAKEPAKSLAQTMKNSGRFEAVKRGIYRLKPEPDHSPYNDH